MYTANRASSTFPGTGDATQEAAPLDSFSARDLVTSGQMADCDWQAESKLIAKLTHLNTCIGRYVMRHLDADAGRLPPILVKDKQALGDQLVALGLLMRNNGA